MTRTYASIHSSALSRRWLVIFALWFSLIIPLAAIGVAYAKAGTPVVRVSGETINNPARLPAEPVPNAESALANAGIHLPPGARFGITAVATDPRNPTNLFVSAGIWLGANPAIYHPLGILHTTDGGKTWSQLPTRDVRAFERLELEGNILYGWNGTQRTSFTLP
jgi:hypothetical protein